MGALTTHVLDTAAGQPARNLRYALFRLQPERRLAAEGLTNADGRCPAPLLEGEAFTSGEYELQFEAGEYFARSGAAPAERPFLGTVVIRFGVADSRQHYHVPLLLSPYGYSTYRGS